MPSWQENKESQGSQGLGHKPNKTDLAPSRWKEALRNSGQVSGTPEAGYLALHYGSNISQLYDLG